MKIRYLGIIFVAVVVLASASAFAFGIFQETKLEVLSNSTLANGDDFTVKLSCDDKGVANKNVSVNIIDANGVENIQNLTTNENGEASFKLDGVADGNYSIECNYKGDWEYTKSDYNTTLTVHSQAVEIEETPSQTTSYSSSKSSSSSSSSGDPYYDANRDASHQSASPDNPVTVYQSDGPYTYYGPGHFDYYAGGNHMSGDYYKYRTENG